MVTRIRRATLGDEGVLAVMNRYLDEGAHAPDTERTGPVSTSIIAHRFQIMLGEPTVRAWLAEQDGTTVGYVLARFHDGDPETNVAGPRCGEVYQFVIHCDDGPTPLAQALVSEVVSAAAREGVDQLTLSTAVRARLSLCGMSLPDALPCEEGPGPAVFSAWLG